MLHSKIFVRATMILNVEKYLLHKDVPVGLFIIEKIGIINKRRLVNCIHGLY